MQRVSPKISQSLARVLEAETENFVELCRIGGLDPSRHFRHHTLEDVDFAGCDLSGFDFSYARFISCSFHQVVLGSAVFESATLLDCVYGLGIEQQLRGALRAISHAQLDVSVAVGVPALRVAGAPAGMDVILLETIEKLGRLGDTVNVKQGYARNYLLPNKKALRSSAENRKVFEANRAKIEAENAARRVRAIELSASIDGKEVVLIRQASATGHLYGSIAIRDIVDALNAEGFRYVTKAMIILERPINSLGLCDVRLALHPEVYVSLHVNVARSNEEADLQRDGVDIMALLMDEDESGFIPSDEEPDAYFADEPEADEADGDHRRR